MKAFLSETIFALLAWTNTNQGALNFFTTLVLAATTFWYARLTRSLVKAGTEPQVIAYLIPDTRHINLIHFVISNVGRGPAYNVSFEIVSGGDDLLEHQARLNESVAPLGILPQDEKIQMFFGMAFTLLKEPRLKPVEVRVTYSNSRGKKRNEKFRLDVYQFVGMGKVGKEPEEEIADALKSIESHISRWNLQRLKVETITTKEQEERDEELREEWEKSRKKDEGEK
jgi:hypothetical protein